MARGDVCRGTYDPRPGEKPITTRLGLMGGRLTEIGGSGGQVEGGGGGSLFFIDFDRLGWFLILGDRATIIDSKFFQIIDTKGGKLVFNQLQFL